MAYLGMVWAERGSLIVGVPLFFVLFPLAVACFTLREVCQFFSWHSALVALVLFGLAATYASLRVCWPPEALQHATGEALIEIEEASAERRYSQSFWKCRAHLSHFCSSDGAVLVWGIPCRVVWKGKDRPRGGVRYRVHGALRRVHGTFFAFDIPPKTALTKEASCHSLVEWRALVKCRAKCFLASHLAPGPARTFLTGVLLGDVADAGLTGHLGRCGLQHITVVSGFHFSLITVILALFFRAFFSWKGVSWLLLVVTTAFLLCIGPTPSVLRAWCSIALLVGARLLERQATGLNNLGVGLGLVLLYDPALVFCLSFQLSFLATGAILLFYPTVSHVLGTYFPRRAPADVGALSSIDQLLYLLLRLFCGGFALVTSVQFCMLPASVALLGQSELGGIAYNCFFPPLVALSVASLFLALFGAWLPFVSDLLFSGCAKLTDGALALIFWGPGWLDKKVGVSWLHTTHLVWYLCIIITMGILAASRDSKEHTLTQYL